MATVTGSTLVRDLIDISSISTTGNVTVGGYLAGPSTFTIDPAGVGDNTGTVVIAGNLQVDGTTTTINSTTVTVDDLNLTLASGAANAAAANGAGLTVDGANATITYDSSNDEWDFNKNINITGNLILSGTVDGRDVATDGSKLDGIEAGATADQTASEILTLIKTVDGSGSGLDADLFDGADSATFLYQGADIGSQDWNSYIDGTEASWNTVLNHSGSNRPTGAYTYGTALSMSKSGQAKLQIYAPENASDNNTDGVWYRTGWNTTYRSWAKFWDSNNDGSGSGLDADLLDGIHGASFLRSDANDTATGIITFRNSTDYQIALNGNSTSWAGISWTDNAGTDYIWFNGSTGTFAIGGGGSTVSGKKLHVDGGMSVGASADSTAMPTNGIYSQGEVEAASFKTSNWTIDQDTNGDLTFTYA